MKSEKTRVGVDKQGKCGTGDGTALVLMLVELMEDPLSIKMGVLIEFTRHLKDEIIEMVFSFQDLDKMDQIA